MESNEAQTVTILVSVGVVLALASIAIATGIVQAHPFAIIVFGLIKLTIAGHLWRVIRRSRANQNGEG